MQTFHSSSFDLCKEDFNPLQTMGDTFNRAAVSDFFDHLLSFAQHNGVTDLHLVEGQLPVARVARTCFQLRWPEEIRDLMTQPESWTLITSAVSEARKQPSPNPLLPQKCAFNFKGVRVRLVHYRCNRKNAVAIRFQPSIPPTMFELGLPESLCKQLQDPSPGLVLISGGPCAGKTTTMAAVVDYYNRMPHFHIRTLESPIEFIHAPKAALITQQQVGSSPEDDVIDYNTAVEEALMQDINMVVIGEIKDLPTLRAALKAANNNLLVFATIHATDVSQTLTRILQDFPESDRQAASVGLARCLKLILCQRLLVKSCNKADITSDEPTPVLGYHAPFSYNENRVAETELAQIQLQVQAGVFNKVPSLRQRVLEARFEGITEILGENRSQLQGCVNQFS